MKKLLQDRERLLKINLYTAYLFAFTIPLSMYFSLKAMALWMLTSVLVFDWKNVKKTPHKLYILLSVFYILWHIVAIFYSDAKWPATWLVAKKFYIAVFPFLFLSVAGLYKKHLDKILAAFVYGSVLAVIIMFSHALYESLEFTENGMIFNPFVYENATTLQKLFSNNFTYGFLSYFKHPMYMSAELVFALAILVFLKRNPYNLQLSKASKLLTNNFVIILLFTVFTITVFLLESRTNLVSLAVIYLLIVLTSRSRHKLALLLITGIFGLIFVLANPRTIYFAETILNKKEVTERQKERALGRLYFWQSAYEIGMTNPVFGVGTGDMQRYLYKKYAERNLVQFMSPEYNAHNQFLENFGQMGVIGLFALLGILGYALYVAIRDKRLLLLAFLVIEFINFIFEVPLCRLDGIVFFAFFLNLLLLIEPFDRQLA